MPNGTKSRPTLVRVALSRALRLSLSFSLLFLPRAANPMRVARQIPALTRRTPPGWEARRPVAHPQLRGAAEELLAN